MYSGVKTAYLYFYSWNCLNFHLLILLLLIIVNIYLIQLCVVINNEHLHSASLSGLDYLANLTNLKEMINNGDNQSVLLARAKNCDFVRSSVMFYNNKTAFFVFLTYF